MQWDLNRQVAIWQRIKKIVVTPPFVPLSSEFCDLNLKGFQQSAGRMIDCSTGDLVVDPRLQQLQLGLRQFSL